MPKFYVESGEYRAIVQANSSHAAALWAMHLAMESSVPLDELELSPEQQEDLEFADAVASLGTSMFVSEIGFGRAERGTFETIEIMTEWNQLTMVLADLTARIQD